MVYNLLNFFVTLHRLKRHISFHGPEIQEVS
jgi:hypothetical protein